MSARASLNKYLPAILFVVCILVALILAFSIPPLWPAALAVALAGAALALSVRAQSTNEVGYLIDDITALQDQNAELRNEIVRTHSIIDELADVVEQVAAATADGATSGEQLDTLHAELDNLRAQAGTVDEGVLARLATLEAQVKATQERAAQALVTQTSIDKAASTNADPVGLRSLIKGAGGEADSADTQTNLAAVASEDGQPTVHASLMPIFQPSLGAPVAFILSLDDGDAPNLVPGLMRHAIQIATELDDADRDVLLFVRLSPAALSNTTVRRDVLEAVERVPALQRRLTMLTSQHGFDSTAQQTLAAIAEQGCKFALENVRDWSLNLGELAQSGLAYIMVDGIAMARSAQDQGGDPRRLTQALSMHNISLIGGGVATKDDIDAVRSLEPALMTGEGLGGARVIEAA